MTLPRPDSRRAGDGAAPTRGAVVLALVCALTAAVHADGRARRVDAVFADLSGDDTPGAAVAVVQDGDVLYQQAYGMADLEHGVRITPRTVFDVASVSKQFGAMAVLLLVEEGAIGLDADVRTYVPEVPAFDGPITVRQLLHHTSGIRDWPHVMALAGVQMSDVIAFGQILRMLERQDDLDFPPGREYSYSNTGYNLLAEIVARVSGRSFRAFTSERIFGPLGMTASRFADDPTEVIPDRAVSYLPREGGGYQTAINQLSALASSSLHTTIDDFTRWMLNFETKRVGGDAGVRALHERGVLSDGRVISYARGLVHGRYRGLETTSHGGSWRGFRTHFLRFPDEAFSVAVFCNVSTCEPARRAQRVADVYLASRLGPGEEARPAETPATPTRRLSAEELAPYVGEFYSPEIDTTYTVVADEGRLRVEHWRNDPVTLTWWAEDRFSSPTWWFREVRFERDASGRVRAFGVSGDRVRHLRFLRRDRP